MFQNVCDTGGVLRHGSQCHHENILWIVAAEMQMHGARRGMLILLHRQIERGDGRAAFELEMFFWCLGVNDC